MIISQKHKFIYLAIPKTASCAIEKALAKYHDTKIETKHNKHAPYTEIAEKLLQRNMNISDFYVFCFFRNPWDWAVSKYFYHKYDCFLEIAGVDIGKAARNMTFLDWVKVDKYLNVNVDYPTITMMEFIGGRSNAPYLNIFTYELLQSGLNFACSQIGIKPEKLEIVNESKLRDHSLGYREHYQINGIYDKQAIEIVEKHFKEEIKYFEYAF